MSEWNLYYGSEEHTPWPITKENFSRLERASREELVRKLRMTYETMLELHIDMTD